MRGRALALTPTLVLPQRNSPPLVGGVRGGGSWFVLAYLLFALMLLISLSCGRKGDPFLPQKSTNARVVDLKGVWQGGYIELKGGIADPAGTDSTATGARVHYAIYPVSEPPCDGCPIEFQGYYTFGIESVREGSFFCKIPGAVTGNIYYFEVQLAGEKGVLGPPSNRAKMVLE